MQPHRAGGRLVDHLVDDLHFQKMVARAERAALVAAAFEGPLADEIGLGVGQAAAGLGVFDVAGRGPAARDQIRRPFGQQTAQLLAAEQVRPARAHAGRNAAEEGVHQLVQPRLNVLVGEVGAHQPHAAVDVVADPARRNHAALGRIGGRHAADAEAVAPVDVGHGQAGHLDARQKGHVGHLFRRLVGANLLDQPLVGEDSPFDLHPDLVALGNPPAALVDLLQRPGVAWFGHGFVLSVVGIRTWVLGTSTRSMHPQSKT